MLRLVCTSPLSVHTAPTTKEHVKDVHGRPEASSSTSSTPSFLYSLLSTTVVNLSLLGVRQHLIRLGDLFKLG